MPTARVLPKYVILGMLVNVETTYESPKSNELAKVGHGEVYGNLDFGNPSIRMEGLLHL